MPISATKTPIFVGNYMPIASHTLLRHHPLARTAMATGTRSSLKPSCTPQEARQDEEAAAPEGPTKLVL
jgi:hypothetical protein